MTRPMPPGAAPVNTAVGPAVGRGAPGRVAEVHAQTRRGLLVAAGLVVAAVVTGAARVGAGWWLPLHLFVVGGLLSAISATTQMFAGHLVGRSPAGRPSSRTAMGPRRRYRRARRRPRDRPDVDVRRR
ncbi:MAG: hypothetical protein WKF58_15885, partial [Ilumatobacteraceae bacterium]